MGDKDPPRVSEDDGSETSQGWTKVIPPNLCFDELSSLSTLMSRDLDVTAYSSMEENIRLKLERQNRRKFLSKRCRFNIALVHVGGRREDDSNISLLREKMLESWVLVEKNRNSAGNEYIYQVGPDSEYFQVSILETTLHEQLINHCETRLNEYLNRKMSARNGVDECIHVCVCLFAAQSLLKQFHESASDGFESDLKMIKRLNDIVSIIPVVYQIEDFDASLLPSIRTQLRDVLSKEVKMFDDWFGQTASRRSIPEEDEEHAHPSGLSDTALDSPLIPGPDFNLFASAVPSNAHTLSEGTLRTHVISKLRSQVLSCPLIVDCTSDFSEQDRKYNLPRFDSFPPTSCDFLRMVLIEGCSLILMERTKTLFGSIAERRIRENQRRQKFENVHHLLVSGVILLAATVSFLKR